ncbi:YveK family protein [Radiobacillus sp. PE A8.2]|uniref:YveK family protein n=1 Tax=Radiobacillus sp. PE A8.2 TaxID=3380349 RepID=UPI003890478C
MEETISLKEIFEVLKKRFLLIVSLVVIAGAAGAVVSYFLITPTYQSSSQFIVNQETPSGQNQAIDINQIRTSVELITTYNSIIKSQYILELVSEELEMPISAGNISVGSPEGATVVTVSVRDTDPEAAANIANTIFTIFKEEVPDLMNGVDNVNILTEAEPNPNPVNPNPMMNIAIAIVLGAMVGIGLAFLLEYLDNTIKAESDIDKRLGLPVLGVISHVDDKGIITEDQFKSARSMRGRGVLDGEKKKSV